ncbi:MAG: hypothetical protein B2I17_09485 [Thermoplasmatales archaeon B_DKE]|nr:MAG: hypothetical protein B2I17_09485 [Thermoplasmatales archaeon B_DKE]
MKVFYPRFKKKELVEKLTQAFREISRQVRISDAMLFGSYAKATNTAFSDIDILVVTEDNKDEVYSVCWDIIGIPETELHIYTGEEIKIMKGTDNLFLKEVERNGVKLLIPPR